MSKISAGLLMYRFRNGHLECLLAHPGGPFWRGKELGAWTVPKGEIEPGEDPLATAQREFEEELGLKPQGPYLGLNPIQQKSGKTVRVWAFEGDCDPAVIRSNHFSMPWPPGSGQVQEFPEVDRAGWFDLAAAREKINPAQMPLLLQLQAVLEERKVKRS